MTEQPMGTAGREILEHENNAFNKRHIRVLATDEVASDGANHEYSIIVWGDPDRDLRALAVCKLKYQNGGLKEVGPNGITDQALLAVILDRMRGFNNGPFRCRENSMIITKLEESLMWFEKRANDRARRNIEGERIA